MKSDYYYKYFFLKANRSVFFFIFLANFLIIAGKNPVYFAEF